jgi:hypothetical protein
VCSGATSASQVSSLTMCLDDVVQAHPRSFVPLWIQNRNQAQLLIPSHSASETCRKQREDVAALILLIISPGSVCLPQTAVESIARAERTLTAWGLPARRVPTSSFDALLGALAIAIALLMHVLALLSSSALLKSVAWGPGGDILSRDVADARRHHDARCHGTACAAGDVAVQPVALSWRRLSRRSGSRRSQRHAAGGPVPHFPHGRQGILLCPNGPEGAGAPPITYTLVVRTRADVNSWHKRLVAVGGDVVRTTLPEASARFAVYSFNVRVAS